MSEGIEIYDDRLRSLLLPNATLQKLTDGAVHGEGPVYFHEDDSVIWSDAHDNRLLHGYPKLTHLKQWSKSLNNMPIWLCFIGAATMFFGGFCLIAGLLTPLAAFGILASMAFALILHIKGGKPFVAQDPYLTPPDDYKGPKGKGEAPSMEKAFVYILIMLVIIVFGPGLYSLDAVLFSKQ